MYTLTYIHTYEKVELSEECLSARKEDEMLVINSFQQNGINDENIAVICEGFVFCSLPEMRNINALFTSQKDIGLSLNADATHKLLFNGWVLPTLSAETINYSTGRDHVSHSPVPLLHACCRFKAQPVYDALLEALKMIGHYYGHDVDNIDLAAGNSDHSYSIINAEKKAEIKRLVDCSIHVQRGMKKHQSLLDDKEYYDTIKLHFRYMQKPASDRIKNIICSAALAEW
jgi:hypothetical protein